MAATMDWDSREDRGHTTSRAGKVATTVQGGSAISLAIAVSAPTQMGRRMIALKCNQEVVTPSDASQACLWWSQGCSIGCDKCATISDGTAKITGAAPHADKIGFRTRYCNSRPASMLLVVHTVCVSRCACAASRPHCLAGHGP